MGSYVTVALSAKPHFDAHLGDEGMEMDPSKSMDILGPKLCVGGILRRNSTSEAILRVTGTAHSFLHHVCETETEEEHSASAHKEAKGDAGH